MTTYDVLVAKELLPEFTNDNPKLPSGFRVVGPVPDPADHRSIRMRVEDDKAPEWTDGKLIEPIFTAEFDGSGSVVTSRISSYREID